MKQIIKIIVVAVLLLLAVGCAIKNPKRTAGYKHISQDEAKTMMAEGNSVIIDVRRPEEYNEGHIPGAICIPNETISSEEPSELPDKDAVILVYCRSGRRSREAAAKLAKLNYTNIYEFGGIINWTGDIEK